MNETELTAVAGPVERGVRPHETRLQQRPVCPHCGYKHDDAWEWNFGPGLEGSSECRECYHCGEEFDCERVVDVSYTTKATRPCTCHPDDNPPKPCAKRFALHECLAAGSGA